MVFSEQVKVLRPEEDSRPPELCHWLCDPGQVIRLLCAPVSDMGTVPFSEWNGWNNDGICLQ